MYSADAIIYRARINLPVKFTTLTVFYNLNEIIYIILYPHFKL